LQLTSKILLKLVSSSSLLLEYGRKSFCLLNLHIILSVKFCLGRDPPEKHFGWISNCYLFANRRVVWSSTCLSR